MVKDNLLQTKENKTMGEKISYRFEQEKKKPNENNEGGSEMEVPHQERSSVIHGYVYKSITVYTF